MDMSSEFCTGLFVGFLVAGILGFVLQQLRLAYIRMGRARRPQQVRIDTSETPVQVVASSAGAGCWLVFLLSAIAALLVLILRYAI
jgi:hypothetical protein